MSAEGKDVFDGMYEGMEDARVSIRINGRDVVERCLSSGIDISDRSTDEGLLFESSATVRYLREEEPDKKADPAAVIEYKSEHMTDYRKARVSGRSELAGIVTLTLRAEFE